MKKILLLFSFSILHCSLSFAQAPNWLWARTATGNVFARGITTDSIGNIYVTGGFSGGSVTLGSITLTNIAGQDIWIAKYDPNGNVLWAKSFGGNSDDIGNSVSIDKEGDIYVAGYYQSPTLVIGSSTLINAGGWDIFLARFDAGGNPVWAQSFGGSSNDLAPYITCDSKQNVYIAGQFYSSSITFGSFQLNSSDANSNSFLAKFDSKGNVIWAETPNAGGGNVGNNPDGITIDANSNIYITGNFQSSTLSLGTSVMNLVSGSYQDIYVIKLDSSGNVHWAKNFGATGGNPDAGGTSLATDAMGNVYVTGNYKGAIISFGVDTLTNMGGFDAFVVRYDSAGNPQWAQNIGGSNDDGGQATAMDANGYLYVTGWFSSPNISIGSYILNNPGPGNGNYADLFIAKYDTAGNALWAQRAGGLDRTGGITITQPAENALVINKNDIYFDGYFDCDSIIFGSDTLNNANPGNSDIFLVKLSTCALNVSTSTLNSSCGTPNGSASAIPSNGTPPYIYSWTNGSKTSSADSLASGLYIVTVTDKNGCTTTAPATVKDAGAPIITVSSVNNITCPGGGNGSITISVSGGLSPYTYYWDNGSTTQNISNLTAGPYQIQVTDTNGCKATEVISINEPPTFALSVSTTSASCSGSNGIATLTASGGTGNYTYLWKPTGKTTYCDSNLAAGSYSVMVTDISGCKDSISADVENAGGP
ncbi:MAG: SBBP repeat-containing protein, partial [Bacteroidia bacterium]